MCWLLQKGAGWNAVGWYDVDSRAVGEQWVWNDHYWVTESLELLSKCLQTVLDFILFSHTETKDGKP